MLNYLEVQALLETMVLKPSVVFFQILQVLVLIAFCCSAAIYMLSAEFYYKNLRMKQNVLLDPLIHIKISNTERPFIVWQRQVGK